MFEDPPTALRAYLNGPTSDQGRCGYKSASQRLHTFERRTKVGLIAEMRETTVDPVS